MKTRNSVLQAIVLRLCVRQLHICHATSWSLINVGISCPIALLRLEPNNFLHTSNSFAPLYVIYRSVLSHHDLCISCLKGMSCTELQYSLTMRHCNPLSGIFSVICEYACRVIWTRCLPTYFGNSSVDTWSWNYYFYYFKIGMSMDPREGSIIHLDPFAKVHARSRIPLDSMAKAWLDSGSRRILRQKTWAKPMIPTDLTKESMVPWGPMI